MIICHDHIYLVQARLIYPYKINHSGKVNLTLQNKSTMSKNVHNHVNKCKKSPH